MDRDTYLNMARQGNVHFQNCKNRHWKNSELVIYGGIKYIPYEYLMRFDKEGNVINIGILHDIKANTLVYANIQQVERIESDNEQK